MSGDDKMKLKHKKTNEIVTIVPHSEPLEKGYSLGLGLAHNKGVSIRRANGEYAFVSNENYNKFFEEVK